MEDIIALIQKVRFIRVFTRILMICVGVIFCWIFGLAFIQAGFYLDWIDIRIAIALGVTVALIGSGINEVVES